MVVLRDGSGPEVSAWEEGEEDEANRTAFGPLLGLDLCQVVKWSR